MRANTLQDFWKFVEPIPEAGCWIWTGKGSAGRYGEFNLQGRVIKAHRLSWEMHCGPIPAGLEICHRCDVGFCVRPEHLFLGTHLENMHDLKRKGYRQCARGSQSGNAKLLDPLVAEIRRRYAAGERQVDLAEAFGVCQSHISRIVRRESWLHL